MSRLRNRMVKADFWTDPELLRWPLAKRMLYQGLWAFAEDSGCLEDDPFGWKLSIFPSPVDSDITVELLTEWRDDLVASGKLYRYEADGKHYLFIRTFHQHEHPRNPQRPDLPLPPWLEHDLSAVKRGDKEYTRSGYRLTKDTLPSPYGDGSISLWSPPPRLAPSRVPKGTRGTGQRSPVDKSTVRASLPEGSANGNGHRTCWRCGNPISGDAILDDLAVLSKKGIRHKECTP